MSDLIKPIEINEFILAIRDLSDEQLSKLKSSLNNSLAKLEESNTILQESIVEPNNDNQHEQQQRQEQDDNLLFKQCIDENLKVIENQKIRLNEINKLLSIRGLNNNKDKETKDETTHETTKNSLIL
ncbi:unnamed protein product [[Candida] boidinii]|uniref:Unnamed protein product n=1 Tax=Candida boidinii TaxID=5477 RepID=A0A9W6T201_CANBO|nr:hypothetical protein B5S30_g5768 [[Candida] boidinii]GME74523.1 unnamed protein product [[Candida] boidinii]GMG07224.1 unnamed protein product [[Candida] boidinii]